MIYGLVAALCFALAGWAFTTHLFLRHAVQQAQDASIERANLCQRIQAPESAVVEHRSNGEVEPVEAVSIFSDDEYWQAQGYEPSPDPED